MKQISFTRNELYDLIWSNPLSQVAKTYNLTDNDLRKRCKEFNIPIPYNGYWQKVKYNKPVKKEKLAPSSLDQTITLAIREEGNILNLDQSPLIVLTKEIQNDPKEPLIVPESLIKPHKVIEQTKLHWADFKKNSYNYDRSIQWLNIRVEPENQKRALLFMNALINLLSYRGHTIKVTDSETFAVVDGIEINVSLREATKRVPPPADKSYLSGDYVPVGDFILKVGRWSSEKEWRDGKVKLETLLARIMAWLELHAVKEKESKERSRLWHLEWEEKKRVEQELKKQRDDEVKKVKVLLDDADRFTKALQLRNYIEARQLKAIQEDSMTTEFITWLAWANEKADWYDPLIDKPDALLD